MIRDGVQKAVDESVKMLSEFFLVYAQDKINDTEYLQGLTDWQLNYLINGYQENEKYEYCIILNKELERRK